MRICDICQRSLELGREYNYTDEQVATVIANGFSPIKCGMKIYQGGRAVSFSEIASALGVNPKQVDDLYRQKYGGAIPGGWVLCPHCHRKVRGFLRKGFLGWLLRFLSW